MQSLRQLINATIQQLEESGDSIDEDVILDVIFSSRSRFARLSRTLVEARVSEAVQEKQKEQEQKVRQAELFPSQAMNERLHKLYRQKEADEDPPKQKKKKRKRPLTDDPQEIPKSLRPMSYSFQPEPIPNLTLASLGGIDKLVTIIRNLVVRTIQHPELCHHLGANPVRGVLLHGPPGCGKTRLALAVAGEARVPFFKVAGPEIVSGVSGESEEMLRSLFDTAKAAAPSLLFIDEVDTICPKREQTARDMERRIVAQLCSCLDDLAGKSVIVLGATNRADALDPMVRRGGRFDRELAIGIPDTKARQQIFSSITEKMKLHPQVDLEHIARLTPGFVGADLEAVAKEAALICLDRLMGGNLLPMDQQMRYTDEQMQAHSIEQEDFLAAVTRVQPSAKREGFATVPDITWEMVGGLEEQRKELEEQVCFPIRHAELYAKIGLDVPAGILLFGPPGCGKTLLAKAVAKESGANFISVKGPELINKYVGESERAIRQVFQRARMSAPCVIFFDELDSLCCRRGADGSSSVTERVVNQLLTEMDGMQERRNVFVVAATNRPDLIDPAMLRPGRLDRLVWVPLPDEAKRADILAALSKKIPVDENVSFETVSQHTKGFSGADLGALLRQAMLHCLQECRELTESRTLSVTMEHIEKALRSVNPSVTTEQLEHYKKVCRKMIKRPG